MQDEAFKNLIIRSREVEFQICSWYKKNVDPKTRMAIPSTKEYDIICPAVGNIEVKEDKMARVTDNYAFEMEDQAKLPSGLACTTAKEFVLVDHELVIRVPVSSMLYLIHECKDKKVIQMGYTTIDGKRAWGYLIKRKHVVYSPYVDVMDKWFK